DALARLPEGASPHAQLRSLVRQHFEVLHGPHADFIPVMLYEWRSLTSTQRQDIAATKDAYEACWTPVLEALHRQGALRADPATARLFILGALNWSVQWFNARGAHSLDALTDQALALFLGDVP
ncbi:MAG: TetR/AcrR family transcriptional regulator, partial [Burkholderiales bacterium]|nr:TetR/AcrR family transcriptional regulator [Burkholderiales bacterium]